MVLAQLAAHTALRVDPQDRIAADRFEHGAPADAVSDPRHGSGVAYEHLDPGRSVALVELRLAEFERVVRARRQPRIALSELLDPAVARVGDVDRSTAVDRDACGCREPAVPTAGQAGLAEGRADLEAGATADHAPAERLLECAGGAELLQPL